MSCHPPTRQVGPYQSEDGPHDELTEQLALTDLHIKPYAQQQMKVYADTSVRIDANQPGVYRWTITRDRQSIASGVAADRDQAANDAAAALAELSR
jgi:hypothetical protein